MKFELPPLPYALDALEPQISKKTLEHHYLKHHKAYVDKLNSLIEGTEYANMDLEEIVYESFENKTSKKEDKKIFNNAAQVWNHTFYWSCMSPNRAEPSSKVSEVLAKYFGNIETFFEKFTQAGKDLFGSGWVWLAKDESGKLSILSKENAENPMAEGFTPVLVCDVWEHAYYLDRQEKRADYLDQFKTLINWKYVEQNLVEKSLPKIPGTGKSKSDSSNSLRS